MYSSQLEIWNGTHDTPHIFMCPSLFTLPVPPSFSYPFCYFRHCFLFSLSSSPVLSTFNFLEGVRVGVVMLLVWQCLHGTAYCNYGA